MTPVRLHAAAMQIDRASEAASRLGAPEQRTVLLDGGAHIVREAAIFAQRVAEGYPLDESATRLLSAVLGLEVRVIHVKADDAALAGYIETSEEY